MPEIKIILSDILKDRNMTQSDLVALTGIRSEAISKLTRGKVERLSLDHLQKIMTALEITNVGEILNYVGSSVIEPITESETDPLDEPIEMLDLPYAIYNKLRKAWSQPITTIRELMDADLDKVRGIGRTFQKTITETLNEYLEKHRK
ncbi:helix-turn-helix domain-containing protein [Sporosarcina sp. FA9]|uniref:helix-turn-helix domain-containing protein n=1 Tax=Sporosarcina sp. FA9 TaxID=3413030 RepID=UPI003F65FFF0